MTNDTAKILEKLKKQEKEEGKLPLLLEFYKKLLQIQSRAQQRFGTPALALSHETIQKRLQNGRPLLRFNDLDLDWSLVQDVFAGVAAAFAGYPQLFGEIPEKLRKPEGGRLLTKKAAEAWFTGKELPRKIRDGVGENILQAMIQATLQPFLAGYARALIDSVEQESWRRRYCPICGGSPDLSFLEKEHGARWLVCSRCDSEWAFQRLQCPYCGNQDQKTLAFFTDDKELYRLYVCEQCKCYLKAVDLRKSEPEILLPLERFYTLDLDAQAREYGYGPYLKPVAGTEKKP
ncbi:MAG: formate dehydrogenase accessory protein FdhE [Dehalococcoidales bacterium]|nr:formate dehydrogenase accessory protein FdhE [Dehalococcoidales bacterium]